MIPAHTGNRELEAARATSFTVENAEQGLPADAESRSGGEVFLASSFVDCT